MPYILVRGNLASYGHRYPWRVLVSGLKGIIFYFEIQILILLIIFKYNILLYIISLSCVNVLIILKINLMLIIDIF